jgi:hypothetical protein
LFSVKNANFFAKFFGENILKIITSVPGHPVRDKVSLTLAFVGLAPGTRVMIFSSVPVSFEALNRFIGWKQQDRSAEI